MTATMIGARPVQSGVLRSILARSVAMFLIATGFVPLAGCTKELNKAAFFGWGGYADTDLEFADFWDGNHTISAWFMPQYPRTYMGPILSNSGSAVGDFPTFIVGLGEYDRNNPADSQPLMIQFGSERVDYTINPPIEPETWHHLAVVRKGCELRLYLDGQALMTDDGETGLRLDPCYDGDLTSDDPVDGSFFPGDPHGGIGDGGDVPVDEGYLPADPGGAGSDVCDGSPGPGVRPEMLRIGRSADGFRQSFDWRYGQTAYYVPQFYGLVDDVAVFSRALSEAEIGALQTGLRLWGNESGLLAGWTFESETPGGNPVPAALGRPIGFHTAVPGLLPVGRTAVSPDRDSPFDARFLPLPFSPEHSPVALRTRGGMAGESGVRRFQEPQRKSLLHL